MRALAVLLAALLPSIALAQTPRVGDWFTYTYQQIVSQGTGEYDGYGDATAGEGRYDVTDLHERRGSVEIHAVYRWNFTSSEGRDDSGAEDRSVEFDVPSRMYSRIRTDLDDYDDQNGRSLATWVWIPPTTQIGDALQVLEHRFQATGFETLRGRETIVLTASGSGQRHDDYGDFSTSWDDTYWFDRESGYFLQSRYEENDSGTYHGAQAGFRVVEAVQVREASYGPTPDPTNWYPAARYGGSGGSSGAADAAVGSFFCVLVVFLFVVMPIGLVVLVIVIARRRRILPTVDARGVPVAVARLAPNAALDLALPGTTTHFEPFLPQLVQAAHYADEPVAVARAGGNVVGLAIHHKDANIGTIFAPDTGVADGLRRDLGLVEFFSEHKHPVPPQVRAEAQRRGKTLPSNDAFNLLETYRVMRVSPLPEVDYDTDLVQRMKDEHLPAVAALAQQVYGVSADRWLRAQIKAGDLGFVAMHDGQVIGFALATAVGAFGRLHTLTVAESARGRGVGKELMRARLRALRDLGVNSAIVEIAHWNLASTRVAETAGFADAGELYIESASTVPTARKARLR